MSIKYISIALLFFLVVVFGYTHESDTPVESASIILSTTDTNRLTDGLVAHYTFDGPDMYPNNVGDVSGQGNHVPLSLGASGNTSTTTSPGKLGQALEFDGVDDEVVLDNLTDFDFSQEDAFTIALWVYPGVNSTADVIISRGHEASSAGTSVYWIRRYGSGTRWQAGISDGTNEIVVFPSDGSLDENTWQHLTLTWDGTTLTLYKNASSLYTGTNGSFTGLWDGSASSIRETSIGADGKGENNYWDGKIDDVRIYNRALSATEVTTLYNLSR